MRTRLTPITQEKINEKVTEIMLLEEEIKKIHQESHKIIYEREDILEPLGTQEHARFIKLNKEYEEKQQRLDHTRAICNNLKQVKKVEDLKQEALVKNSIDYLTKQERTVLTFFNSSFPNSVKSKDIRTGLNLSKGCVHAHLRSFLIAGLIKHNTSNEGTDCYLLTCKGKNHLERSSRLIYIKENFGI